MLKLVETAQQLTSLLVKLNQINVWKTLKYQNTNETLIKLIESIKWYITWKS